MLQPTNVYFFKQYYSAILKIKSTRRENKNQGHIFPNIHIEIIKSVLKLI
jgi:hypothetical protein